MLRGGAKGVAGRGMAAFASVSCLGFLNGC
jgi:hypothetical protein